MDFQEMQKITRENLLHEIDNLLNIFWCELRIIEEQNKVILKELKKLTDKK